MAKVINEKTFELNITNELLNISKSFIWYLDQSPISHLLPKHVWNSFMQQSMFYAVGLTQDEESVAGGGYDVSIDLNSNTPFDRRLLLLQFKSGVHRKRCNATQSLFHHSRPSEHIQFVFNDAAKQTQHIILRDLANRPEIQSESVLYVFPRITTRKDLLKKIGNLIWDSSFVPILDLDRQGANQNPPVSINAGVSHNFRTSPDGTKSEVNFYYYIYYYDASIVSKISLELICIQIERFAKILLEFDKSLLEILFKYPFENISYFKNPVPTLLFNSFVLTGISNFINEMEQHFMDSQRILNASSTYTTIIPRDGLKIKLDEKLDYSEVSYQVF